MKKTFRLTTLLFLLIAALFAGAGTRAEYVSETVLCGAREDASGTSVYVILKDLTPYVFMPTGAGSGCPEDFTNAYGIMTEYGDDYGFEVVANAGIFYANDTERLFGYHYKEADGPVIAGGVVLKSTETMDHTECSLLVIDEYGMAGWAPYDADADALAAGTGLWYDIYGREVTGRKIVSAVAGFCPILVNAEPLYDKSDKLLHGYDNYATHYTNRAMRQVFGMKANGDYVLLSPGEKGWTLNEAGLAAKKLGCVFAYNLDGGGSTCTAVHTPDGIRMVTGKSVNARTVPTFLVFTAGEIPESAVPVSLRRGEETGKIFVQYENANGKTSERELYSSDDAEEPGECVILGGAEKREYCKALKKHPGRKGVPVYTKTAADEAACLKTNGSTRIGGRYYDYSSGYRVTSMENGSVIEYVTGGKILTLSAD